MDRRGVMIMHRRGRRARRVRLADRLPVRRRARRGDGLRLRPLRAARPPLFAAVFWARPGEGEAVSVDYVAALL